MTERTRHMDEKLKNGFIFRSTVSNVFDGHLGISKPAHREVFFNKIGVKPESVVDIGTENGGTVKVATKKDAGKVIAGCDGIITAEKDMYIALVTADCLPIKIMDPVGGVIGLVHAGWNGLKSGIVKNALIKMKTEFGSKASDTEIVIAPGICANHYEVKDDVASLFYGIRDAVLYKDDKMYLDLSAVAKRQMYESGVRLENIYDSGICTFENGDYFSHRRNANPGRFMTILGISSQPA